MVWDAEEAAARFRGFRGRRQSPVAVRYGAVWLEHIKLRSAAETDACTAGGGCHIVGL